MRFGLSEDTIAQVHAVLSRFPQVNTAVLYGSRAAGTHRNGSDIDLTLKGRDLDLSMVNKIRLELDDLPVPYTFDISIFDRIVNPDLVDRIEKAGVVFYERAGGS